MSYKIQECSPKAKAKIQEGTKKKFDTFASEHHKAKYPFSMLDVGECFTVPIDEVSELSLRIMASRNAKKLSRKFTVIKHAEYGIHEAARIE